MALTDSLVDLWFPVRGPGLPEDHGFMLYTSLCQCVEGLHGNQEWGLHTMRGARSRDGQMSLDHRSRFGLRLPIESVPAALTLNGRHLPVGSADLLLGRAVIERLRGWRSLFARLVTVRGFMDPDEFADALRRQLEIMGIEGHIVLGRRREIHVHGQPVVGFSVRVDDLSNTDSLHLQASGLGGRRRMGCGMFHRARGSDLAELSTLDP